MPKKNQTNVEFVTEMMEFSKTGGLSQCFIMEAIIRYANEVLENQDALRKSMKNHIIAPEAWIATAAEIQEKCKLRIS